MMVVGFLAPLLAPTYGFRVTVAHLKLWWHYAVFAALIAAIWLLDR